MSGSRYSCPCSISPAWPWPNALAHGVLRPTRCAHTLAARRRILTVCRPCSRLLLLPPSPSLLVPRIPPLRGHSRPCLSAAASTRCRLCAGPARARLVGIHEGSGGHRRGTCAAWRNRAVKQDHEKTPTREANVHLMFEIQERWGGPRLPWTHMVLICSRPPVTCAPAARRVARITPWRQLILAGMRCVCGLEHARDKDGCTVGAELPRRAGAAGSRDPTRPTPRRD